MITAKDVENILRLFREADDEAAAAVHDQHECETRQNDILHELEFVEHSHNERGRIGKELVEVRRKRRVAKNTSELLSPLCQWIADNQAAINALKRTLGDMRKIDEKHSTRMYYCKSTDTVIPHQPAK